MNNLQIQASEELAPKAAFTGYTNSAGPLGKHFSIEADGNVIKTPRADLVRGRAERHEVASLAEFAALRRGLKEDQALGFGVCEHGVADLATGATFARRTRLAAADGVPVLTRSKEHFHWPRGPGIFMLDHDPLPGLRTLGAMELHEALCTALPLLRGVQMLWMPSVGSCVVEIATQREVVPLNGARMYMLIDDAAAIPEVGRVLFDRLVLAGYGAIKLSGNGSMLERTIIDASVLKPQNYDFARATYASGLARGPQTERLFGPEDHRLRAGEVMQHALSAAQRSELAARWAALRASMASDAVRMREAWAQARAEESLAPDATAEQIGVRAREFAQAAEGGKLVPGQKLQLQDGRTVTVKEVLATPSDFYGLKLHDPIEPHYGNNDNRIATICEGKSGAIYIRSFAHGGITYELKGRDTAEEDLAGMEEGDEDEPVSACARNAVSKSNAKLRVWRPGELALRQPPRWLVRGWLPEQGVASLVGESNVGKSFLMLQLCVSIAQGWDWLGFAVEQGAALYVAAEGGFGMKARMAAIAEHYGASLDHAPCGVVTEGLDLRSSSKDADRVIAAAREFATRVGQPLKLVVLDTLARMMAGGDENSSVDMGSLINSAARIAEETGALVVLVHHTGKDASKGARGHSSLRAAMDAQVIVEKRNGLVEMRLDKQRDGPTDLHASYRLHNVQLGVSGDDLEATSSAVVVLAHAVIAPSALKLGEWQTYALDAWREANAAFACPTFEDVMSHAELMLAELNKLGENSRRMLRRAMNQLVDESVLIEEDGGYSAGLELERALQGFALH